MNAIGNQRQIKVENRLLIFILTSGHFQNHHYYYYLIIKSYPQNKDSHLFIKCDKPFFFSKDDISNICLSIHKANKPYNFKTF